MDVFQTKIGSQNVVVTTKLFSNAAAGVVVFLKECVFLKKWA